MSATPLGVTDEMVASLERSRFNSALGLTQPGVL